MSLFSKCFGVKIFHLPYMGSDHFSRPNINTLARSFFSNFAFSIYIYMFPYFLRLWAWKNSRMRWACCGQLVSCWAHWWLTSAGQYIIALEKIYMGNQIIMQMWLREPMIRARMGWKTWGIFQLGLMEYSSFVVRDNRKKTPQKHNGLSSPESGSLSTW